MRRLLSLVALLFWPVVASPASEVTITFDSYRSDSAAPGGLHERYFEEGWELVDDLHNPPPPREPDFQRVGAALQAAGMEMLPTT